VRDTPSLPPPRRRGIQRRHGPEADTDRTQHEVILETVRRRGSPCGIPLRRHSRCSLGFRRELAARQDSRRRRGLILPFTNSVTRSVAVSAQSDRPRTRARTTRLPGSSAFVILTSPLAVQTRMALHCGGGLAAFRAPLIPRGRRSSWKERSNWPRPSACSSRYAARPVANGRSTPVRLQVQRSSLTNMSYRHQDYPRWTRSRPPPQRYGGRLAVHWVTRCGPA
jgi:hypothetical protein